MRSTVTVLLLKEERTNRDRMETRGFLRRRELLHGGVRGSCDWSPVRSCNCFPPPGHDGACRGGMREEPCCVQLSVWELPIHVSVSCNIENRDTFEEKKAPFTAKLSLESIVVTCHIHLTGSLT